MAPPAPHALQVGSRLGRYELTRFLGEGGFAEVWLGRDAAEPAKGEVALKVVRRGRVATASERAMFLDEANIAAGIRHENVARVFEIGDESGLPYLVMEYVAGGSLETIARGARALGEPVPTAIGVALVAATCAGARAPALGLWSDRVVRLRALALCLLLGSRAAAQGADTTADAASALYVEGKELRDAGDLARSLEKLEAAHALYATPITALEVGRARALVGRLRGAIEALESIERLPVKPNESAKATAARAEARGLLAQYRARIPTLVLRAPSDARVWVDGEVVPQDALASPWLVDPGPHHVEAARGPQRTSQDVRLAEGEQRGVTLTLEPAAAAPPTGSPAPASPAPALPAVDGPAHASATGSPNVLAYITYIGLGIGAAGVATGTITGIVTLSRAGDIKPQCRAGVCPSSAGLDSAQTLGTVSTFSRIRLSS